MNKTSALHLSLVRNNVNDNVDSKLKQYKELEIKKIITARREHKLNNVHNDAVDYNTIFLLSLFRNSLNKLVQPPSSP